MKRVDKKLFSLFRLFVGLIPIVVFIAYILSIVKSTTSITDIFTNFTNFISANLSSSVFGLDNFVSFISTKWFGGNMPDIYKVVILLLSYELVVEVFYLFFDCIISFVRIFRKWVNGFYA